LKSSFTLLLVFILTVSINQIDKRYAVVKAFREFQLFEASKNTGRLEASISKIIFKYEYQYLTKGINTFVDFDSLKTRKIDYLDSILIYNYLGDYYFRRESPNDSFSFNNYAKALDIAKEYDDTLLINESLRRINEHFLKNYKDKKLYKKYVNELAKYKQNTTDDFWDRLYSLIFEMTYASIDKNKAEFDELEVQKLAQKFLALEKGFSDNIYFKGLVNHHIGNFYTYPKYNEQSRKHYLVALDSYKDSTYHINGRRLNTSIAFSMSYFDDHDYDTAIGKLKEHLNNDRVKNSFRLKQLIYKKIYESYKAKKVADSAQYFLELHVEAKDSMKYYLNAAHRRDNEIKRNVKAIKQQNEALKKQNDDLQDKLVSFIPILSIIVVVLIVVFILYRRNKKKNQSLEKEKSDTLKKLDEIQKIVIKNHIVLKDKTKIYISDLMYIKADDHYLKIHIANNKTHLVRGKLKQIKEELPPNFIRCHRSYIVNTNFIKQINATSLILINQEILPISRSYKDNFE